jgi:hypothetical protein
MGVCSSVTLSQGRELSFGFKFLSPLVPEEWKRRTLETLRFKAGKASPL